MDSRRTEMQAIFGERSERNKDMMILPVKSVKIARKAVGRPQNPPRQTA